MILLLSLLACKDGEPVDTALDCTGAGTICTVAGTGLAGLGEEGVAATESHLYLPIDLSISPVGVPMIIDWNNHRLRVLEEDGSISTVAGTGLLGDGPEGPGMSATFNHPTDLSFDGQGGVYIAAWHNSRIERLDSDYNLSFECGTGARSYSGDGLDAKASALDLPSSVVIDGEGRVFLTDQANQLIRYVEDGVLWDFAGTQRVEGYSGDGGPAKGAKFHAAVGQAADPANRIAYRDGAIYLADTGNSVIRIIDVETGIIDTFAGAHTCDESTGECTSTAGYGGDGGPKEDAVFNAPADLEFGPDGDLFVADTANHCVRKIAVDGTVSTAAGVCGEEGFDGDGGPASDARLARPYGIDVDADGAIWIADTYNHRIRLVNP